MYCLLPQRGLIRISGDDAVPFLQGLVSNDVTKLAEKGALYAALLSPQGKFLHDFFLIHTPDAILIDCEKARLEDLIARLKMYKLRSKVVIEPTPEPLSVAAFWEDKAQGTRHKALNFFPDPRLPEMGYRIISKAHPAATDTPNDYDHMRLELGIPDGSRDMIVDKSLLLECGFEELHGVDFGKGCYVGQEVTARSKFRAQLKKSFYTVSSETAPLPAPGTPITIENVEIGQLRSSAGNIGLAILRREEVDKSPVGLLCGNIPIKTSLPAWLKEH